MDLKQNDPISGKNGPFAFHLNFDLMFHRERRIEVRVSIWETRRLGGGSEFASQLYFHSLVFEFFCICIQSLHSFVFAFLSRVSRISRFSLPAFVFFEYFAVD